MKFLPPIILCAVLCLFSIPIQAQVQAQETEAAQTRTLTVMLTDNEGDPIVDQQIQARFMQPMSMIGCRTDEDGICVVQIESDEEFVRGQVMVVGRGIRPFIWRGESLDLFLKTDENDLIVISTDFLPTPTSDAPTPTVEPIATANAGATAELVATVVVGRPETATPAPTLESKSSGNDSETSREGERSGAVGQTKLEDEGDSVESQRRNWKPILIIVLILITAGLIAGSIYVGFWTYVWGMALGLRGED